MTVKQAEYTGNDSEYLAGVIESSPVALIALDTRLRVAMFNLAAAELTGWSRDEVIGSRVNRIIGTSRAREIIGALRDHVTRPDEGYVTRFRRSDGEELPVRLTVRPIVSPGGGLAGVILLVMDLRDIRQLQEEIVEAERLAAITETAVGVNHEINNPLCSILGYTQLILMEGERLDPEVVEKLRGIETQILRIQEVADRLGRIRRPVLTDYVGGRKMLDVEQSSSGGGEDEEQ